MSPELNVFKVGYVVLLLFNIVTFAVAWTIPTHTNFAEYYSWLVVACAVLIALDILITTKLLKGKKEAEIFDTATIETDNSKYLLQRFKVPIIAILLLALVFGAVWGAWYMQAIQFEQKPFLFVPTLYSSLPATGWARSEERRGGKECRSRWSPTH